MNDTPSEELAPELRSPEEVLTPRVMRFLWGLALLSQLAVGLLLAKFLSL